MPTLKVTKIGNSLGVILPKELLSRFHLDKGDSLFVTEAPGAFTLSPYNEAFDEQMKVARSIMKQRRAALRELAK